MKLFPLLLLATLLGHAQSGTEVYLLALDSDTALINISQNPGYDNQPSFWDQDQLLYTATRMGQTDIVRYNLKQKSKQWLCSTPQGSEYSPLRIPGSEDFSAIRLDTTGLQHLYRYSKDGQNSGLFPPLKIGYHRWLSSTEALCTVLVEGHMNLVFASTNASPVLIAEKVGRSLHRIPNTSTYSFIKQVKEKSILQRFDLSTKAITPLLELPAGVQDVAWLNSGELIYGQHNQLYRWDPQNAEGPQQWKILTGIKNISRIAVSPQGNHLALVGKE